jgi:hypothetical protein
MVADVTDPTVRAFIDAINSHDKDAFYAVLTPDATMSDDGAERDLRQWADRELFDSNGHMEVDSATDGGRTLLARNSNDTWGEMRTRWHFTIEGDKISRYETGQA